MLIIWMHAFYAARYVNKANEIEGAEPKMRHVCTLHSLTKMTSSAWRLFPILNYVSYIRCHNISQLHQAS